MIILIHGIFTEDSSKTIGTIKKHDEDAESFDYGYVSVVGALLKNNSIAKDLAKKIKNTNGPVTIYAHSNGNAVSVIAADKYGAQIENLICIAPALNRNLTFPPSIKNILVLSTRKDKATKSARFFDSVPIVGWLVPDIWGSMGTDNYIGTDPRITKVCMDSMIDGHSDYFSEDTLPKVMSIINEWLSSR